MSGRPDTTGRFSGRAADYHANRPGYPDALLDYLIARCGLGAGMAAADMGSGTGKLSELLLRGGGEVFGVEPNADMRSGAEALLGGNPRFHSVAGTAEASGLPDGSVYLVAAGQAFHWFDRGAAGREFRRILKPGGQAALIWNDRQATASRFTAGYDALLERHCPEYQHNTHRGIEAAQVRDFFEAGSMASAVFPYRQTFTREGLQGRAKSSSYVPASGPAHDALMEGLAGLFETHREEGRVAFQYLTKVFHGVPA